MVTNLMETGVHVQSGHDLLKPWRGHEHDFFENQGVDMDEDSGIFKNRGMDMDVDTEFFEIVSWMWTHRDF